MVSFEFYFCYRIIDMGAYSVYLVMVVTCSFLLDKQGYFVDTSVFCVVVIDGCMRSCLGILF